MPRPTTTHWNPGNVVIRRGIDWGHPTMAMPMIVVEDSPDLLATFVMGGTTLGFDDEFEYPYENGKHPWADPGTWQGDGVLMLQRAGDPYSVWHFWHGENREFLCWYLNLERPYVRTEIGYDTEDHELDIIAFENGTWMFKDEEVLRASIDPASAVGGQTLTRFVGCEQGERADSGCARVCPRV